MGSSDRFTVVWRANVPNWFLARGIHGLLDQRNQRRQKLVADLTAEQASLADSEQRYRLLAENATDVVWQLDADDLLVWISPSVESVLGWRREQLLGTSMLSLVHADDQETRAHWKARLFAGVDSLKSVNEALTHAAGDRVIVEIAARIATVEGDPDLLARGSGIATGGHNAYADELLRDAALAMRKAEDNGRDRCEFFNPIWHWMRWVRPDGTRVGPNDFLPVAERSALIADLDFAIMNPSIDLLGHLSAPIHMAVNVSAGTLVSIDYEQAVTEALSRSGADPSRIASGDNRNGVVEHHQRHPGPHA